MTMPAIYSGNFCLVGVTPDGRKVLGGAFQMADTLGFPLSASMDEAEQHGAVISLAHYFASALEHGWDDAQAFTKMREALVDRGQASTFPALQRKCVAMFMRVAETMPGASAAEIGKRMREVIEEV